MTIQDKPKPELGKYTYLNPDFMPDHLNEEYCREHRASGLAYDLNAIIKTAYAAVENDGLGLPLDRRGIGTTLNIAMNMAGDLIDACELLEGRLPKEPSPQHPSAAHLD